MVGNAIRDESEFGIVLARKDGIVNAGCTVKVEKVMEMYPDGRMDVLTLGERRFEIDGRVMQIGCQQDQRDAGAKRQKSDYNNK